MSKLEELGSMGYTIKNARITSVDMSMADHGCLTLYMVLEGSSWSCVYGGYCLGHGYLDTKEFDSTPNCGEYIMRIMDTVGVSDFNDMKGKYIRVATKGWGGTIKIIGNIIEDKWFDTEEFFNKTKSESSDNE